MRKSRFSEEQIIAILKEHQAGCRSRIFAASTGSAMRRSTTGGRGMAAWRSRTLAPEGARGGEPEAEEAAGGVDAGRVDAA